MEAIVLLVLLVVALILIVPIVAIAKASGARRAVEELAVRVGRLERLRQTAPQTSTVPVQEEMIAPSPVSPVTPVAPVAPVSTPSDAVPPPLPATVTAPKPSPKFTPPPKPFTPVFIPARTAPVVNWEQFMGAKLFAWIGGFALFLGVAFFVKYSFEHNLVLRKSGWLSGS